jgi:hypothetical protein
MPTFIRSFYEASMARLVLDEEAMTLAVQQIAGRPVLGAPGGVLLEPRIIDLIEEKPNPTGWQPLNDHSRLLLEGHDSTDLHAHGGRP